MMYRRFCKPPRPRWWPENEQWPPPRAMNMWRRRRVHLVGRLTFAFAAILLLSGVGIASIFSTIGGNAPFGSPVAATVLWVAVLVMLLVAGVRRVGLPFGNIVEASDRVAGGDFAARVPEHGPPSLRIVGRAFNSMAARLERQEQQRRQLMADIAHELRTPLSVVQGRLEGLLDGIYARDDRSIGEILQETRLLARLVDDLQTLAHAEGGTLALHVEQTDVAALVRDVVSGFAAEGDRAGVSLAVDAAGNLPPASIDPLRIREVIANLLSNALKHTAHGGSITLSASADEANASVAVSVTDTGSGIAPDELPKVFNRFHKGAGSRGSGLGLAIARNLVVAHGGDITAKSRLGEGTTIRFTLPAGR